MSRLRETLESLRPHLAKAAQEVLDAWRQDGDGYDERYGSGGACDDINAAIQGLLYEIDGVGVIDGGHEGDDHAWSIVYDSVEAFAVDIPSSVYEEGGGYSWRKKEGVRILPNDISISPVCQRFLEAPVGDRAWSV